MGKAIYRRIMEESLGRVLNPWEIIHHVDGNHFNNDLKNLQIVSFKEHIQIHQFLNKIDVKFRKRADKEEKIQVLRKEIKQLKVINNELIENVETILDELKFMSSQIHSFWVSNSMEIGELFNILGKERTSRSFYSKG